jgi:hypothetical protein
LAAAVILRPNFFPLAATVAGGAWVAAIWQRQFDRAVALAAGFSAVGSMALHNWVFGGTLVPFGTNAELPDVLLTPPRVYALAVVELLRLDVQGVNVAQAAGQVWRWLEGPFGKPYLTIFHAAEIVILIRVAAFGAIYDPWLRLISGATLTGHAVGLFYAPTLRYHLLTWALTSLVALVWLQREGIPAIRRFRATGGADVARPS